MALGTVVFYPNYFHYAGFTRSSEPSITAESYTCSGGETSNGVYDVVDNRRGNVVTIDTNGETTEPTLDMDLSTSVVATISPTFQILDNHNLTTADAQVKVQYGTGPTDRTLTAAYSGVYGEALSTESVSSNYIQNPADGILLATHAAVASSHWNLLFLYDPDSYDADITIGEWAAGVSCTPSYSPEVGSIYTYQYKGVTNNVTSGGVKYGFKRYGKQRAWKLTWEYLSATDRSNLETVFDVTSGEDYPFWIDLGEAATPQLYYVRFVGNKLDFKYVTGGAYSLSVVIEEEA